MATVACTSMFSVSISLCLTHARNAKPGTQRSHACAEKEVQEQRADMMSGGVKKPASLVRISYLAFADFYIV